jgi:hypothetical protein
MECLRIGCSGRQGHMMPRLRYCIFAQYIKLFEASQFDKMRTCDHRKMDRRKDRRTALLIEASINAAASHGPIPAARELIAHGVPWEVVMRTLTRPAERPARPSPDQPPPTPETEPELAAL